MLPPHLEEGTRVAMATNSTVPQIMALLLVSLETTHTNKHTLIQTLPHDTNSSARCKRTRLTQKKMPHGIGDVVSTMQPTNKCTLRERVLSGRLNGAFQFTRITSQRLLDQSQAGVYQGKHHVPRHFGPSWAYSRTLPQGVELLV